LPEDTEETDAEDDTGAPGDTAVEDTEETEVSDTGNIEDSATKDTQEPADSGTLDTSSDSEVEDELPFGMFLFEEWEVGVSYMDIDDIPPFMETADTLALKTFPLFEIEDIVSWERVDDDFNSNHEVILTEEASDRLAQMDMGDDHGMYSALPVVVTANGERIYTAVFWPPNSAQRPPCINLLYFPAENESPPRIIILGSGEDEGAAMNDPRLWQVLTDAGVAVSSTNSS
jgi:hypothetical protein